MKLNTEEKKYIFQVRYCSFLLFLVILLPITLGIFFGIYSFIEKYYYYIIFVIFLYFYIKYKIFRNLFALGFLVYVNYYYYKNTKEEEKHYAFISHPCGRVRQLEYNKFDIWYDSNCLEQLNR